MNCKRVYGLLSAFLDAELTDGEMDGVRAHINECPHCRGEYQSLLDTKRLLASLAHRASRAEIDALMQADRKSPAPMMFGRVLRPRPLAATALLSLAGLWAASASLDSPADGTTPGAGGMTASMNSSAYPGFGMDIRGLRSMLGAGHGGDAVMLPNEAPSPVMVMSAGSPYPIAVRAEALNNRQVVSLSHVFATATNPRPQLAAPVPVSLSPAVAAIEPTANYRDSSDMDAAYSVSVLRVNRGSWMLPR